MAIKATITRVFPRNTPTLLTSSTGSGTTAGKAEDFFFQPEAADEKTVLLIANEGSAEVSVQVLSAGGFAAHAVLALAAGKMAAIFPESGSASGDSPLTVRITPPSGATVANSNIKLYAACGGILTK